MGGPQLRNAGLREASRTQCKLGVTGASGQEGPSQKRPEKSEHLQAPTHRHLPQRSGSPGGQQTLGVGKPRGSGIPGGQAAKVMVQLLPAEVGAVPAVLTGAGGGGFGAAEALTGSLGEYDGWTVVGGP